MRPIDADALIATLRESKYMIIYSKGTLPIIQNNEIERCISFVETAPTIKTFTLADIEEQYRKGLEKGLEEAIPHGEWIYHAEWEFDGECAYECSQCGMGSDVDYDFCMGCGADMRKQKEGEQK